ncbi:hypothetical protein [Pelagimonas varians]|uniref:Cytochrome c domain-containing protein n=1 Tax=Pelagimonas varians TaxID=696760 RepID=A0A238L236_9RHOB|nr:hypothetical protein [Pelagimonas varians]PYG26848.1 hypothetical protein C8N36_11939 [Pelagimonas varians]SMX48881.1 hypothetical protein PEV8663_03994 [Pelagimonas varians]
MLETRMLKTALAALVCAASFGPAQAQGSDAQTLFETKCGSCHVPDASEFLEQKVIVTGDGLVGEGSKMPVQTFLESGHGRLEPAEITLIMEHLETVQDSSQLILN